MLFVKTPRLLKLLFPKLVWDIPVTAKEVYLTFDDGPTPEITEWVLQQLRAYNAKATFFCIGKNVDQQPEIFKQVLAEGHSIGNHTYNHFNGWKVSKQAYLSNVVKAEDSIVKLYPEFADNKLFRPPYGKFTPSIVKSLVKRDYKVIAWDIITEDYDAALTPEKVFANMQNNVQPGSVIVFHDSVKAFKNLKAVLPKTLAYLKEQGYTFKAL